jgi:hypothetical protein
MLQHPDMAVRAHVPAEIPGSAPALALSVAAAPFRDARTAGTPPLPGRPHRTEGRLCAPEGAGAQTQSTAGRTALRKSEGIMPNISRKALAKCDELAKPAA